MKKRVADIVMDILLENHINTCFAVVGGGAMHIDNALALRPEIEKVFCHHEQACTMAAEAYAKTSGKMAFVSVTSGPGGINALNGVQGAYVDSVPMLIIAGHPRWNTTVNATGLDLRWRGVQEYDIVPTLFNMTKYAKMVLDPLAIRQEVQLAIDIALEGRKGPTWLSIPLDIQGTMVETEELYPTIIHEERKCAIEESDIKRINSCIEKAKRPVILAGTGIRMAGAVERFREWTQRMHIPVVAGSLLPDIMYEGAPYFYGTSGSTGERRGNFILQNADFILVIGNSLSTKQTGFNQELFAPSAKILMIDAGVDEEKKPGLHIDDCIHIDIKLFFEQAYSKIIPWIENEGWIQYCDSLHEKLGMVDAIVEPNSEERIPSQWLWKMLRAKLPENAMLALGNSSGIVGGLQHSVQFANQRVIVNYNCGSMGDDLPEAIGMAVASKREVICVTGDGSIMMNLQELQTIVHYDLPIKVIILSNDGYGAIRQTNKNYFNGIYIGCDKNSGISMPDFEKVILAFGLDFKQCKKVNELEDALDWLLMNEGRAVLEVFQKLDDPVLPKIMSKLSGDGQFTTPALQDMYPYLSDELMNELMSISKK